MSISPGMSHRQLDGLAHTFADKVKTKATEGEFVLNMKDLDKAFKDRCALGNFANDVLELRHSEFNTDTMNSADLEQLKGLVIGKLGKVRAGTREFTSDSKSVFSWLRDKFMTFFMSRSASFHSETMFHTNDNATKDFKNLLTQSSTLGAPNPDISTSEIDGFVVVGNPSLAASATSAGGTSAAGSATGTPESTGDAETFKINPDIVRELEVIDTPRDGSCMLWALETISANGNLGEDNDARIKARDVTIPEYRQMISVGLRMEAANLRNQADILEANILSELIQNSPPEPKQQEYWAMHIDILKAKNSSDVQLFRGYMNKWKKRNPEEMKSVRKTMEQWERDGADKFKSIVGLRKTADKLEARAPNMELSGGIDPDTWSGEIGVEPSDMRFIAPTLGKDIAIITKIKGETIYYLCTKEGKFIDPRQPQGEGMETNDFKDRFEEALKAGPAIFAEDGHARAVRYTPPRNFYALGGAFTGANFA